jgi:hypothetical protein
MFVTEILICSCRFPEILALTYWQYFFFSYLVTVAGRTSIIINMIMMEST